MRGCYLPPLERSADDEPIETPLPPPYQKLVERINQLQGMLLNTREKMQEHLKEKPFPSPPSYLYKSIKEESDGGNNEAK